MQEEHAALFEDIPDRPSAGKVRERSFLSSQRCLLCGDKLRVLRELLHHKRMPGQLAIPSRVKSMRCQGCGTRYSEDGAPLGMPMDAPEDD